MKKYNILRKLAKDRGKSQNKVLKEFRAKGLKIGNEKGRRIIRGVREDKSVITKERDEYIKELLKDTYTKDPLTFKELSQKVRGAGYKIGNEALLNKYREIRLYDKIASLKKSVEEGRMQKTTAEHIEAKMRNYFRKGQINNLNNLYGRLYDVENNPTFMDS